MVKENVRNFYLGVLSQLLEKSEEELAECKDSRMIEDLGMTSMQLFPLIGALVDEYDIDVDYADFLTNVHTVNEGIDYVFSRIAKD
ncbi:MAG: hypothetical protein J6K75_07740 [Erysipelotrichaceae bacterium]|nr:hypothetical protein [Erysipelotrichaceae bacterium]